MRGIERAVALIVASVPDHRDLRDLAKSFRESGSGSVMSPQQSKWFLRSQRRAAAGCIGGSVDELTDAERIDQDLHGPLTREASDALAAGVDSLICWYTDVDDIQLDIRHGPAVFARRAELGRPLDAADLRSIVDADGGPDVQTEPRAVRFYQGAELVGVGIDYPSETSVVRQTTCRALFADEIGEIRDAALGQQEGNPAKTGVPDGDSHLPRVADSEVGLSLLDFGDRRVGVDRLSDVPRYLGGHLAAQLRQLKDQLLKFVCCDRRGDADGR